MVRNLVQEREKILKKIQKNKWSVIYSSKHTTWKKDLDMLISRSDACCFFINMTFFFSGSNSMSIVIWFFWKFFFFKYCLSEENVYVNSIIPLVVLNSGSGAIVRFIFIMAITPIVINATTPSTWGMIMRKKLN